MDLGALFLGEDSEILDPAAKRVGALGLRTVRAATVGDLPSGEAGRNFVLVVVSEAPGKPVKPQVVTELGKGDKLREVVWIADAAIPLALGAGVAVTQVSRRAPAAQIAHAIDERVRAVLFPQVVVDLLASSARQVMSHVFNTLVALTDVAMSEASDPDIDIAATVAFAGSAANGTLVVSSKAAYCGSLYDKAVTDRTSPPPQRARAAIEEISAQFGARLRAALLERGVDVRCGFPIVMEGLAARGRSSRRKISLRLRFEEGKGALLVDLFLDDYKNEAFTGESANAAALRAGQVHFL